MIKRMHVLSILISLLFILALCRLTVFANEVPQKTVILEDEPEKVLFCTFDEGTTNVSYTPTTR